MLFRSRKKLEQDIEQMDVEIQRLTELVPRLRGEATKAWTALTKKIHFLQRHKHVLFKGAKSCINCDKEAKFEHVDGAYCSRLCWTRNEK